ncbi:MAG: Lrp/AsnC family transcriptional regulator [Planctomycetota bacterium]|nr:MAG: Lrp/AsnC family transcriptional regulator [Planctomycetota bacterium]
MKEKQPELDLDESDIIILEQLQRDCRQTVAQIATKAHLSTSACHRRIKALEENGVITGYVAKLSSRRLGYSVEFFVELSLATQAEGAFEEFEREVLKIPEVLECYLVGGQYDYLLRVVAVDAEDYERIHRQSISRLPGVTKIQSILSLRCVKPMRGLPLR